MNILHITPDFNYACGRSYYVYLLIKYFKRNNHNIYLATNGGDSFDRISELEVPVFIIKGLKSKNPIIFTKSIKTIRDILLENEIDLVHTHHRYAELLAIRARQLVRSKKTVTVHTALSIVDKKYSLEYKSDKIIAVSKSVLKMLTERFDVQEEKVEMIPNFADTEELLEVESLMPKARGHGRFYNILAIGRFHHEKNFETLLEALHLLKDPEMRLLLIGEGDKYSDYRTYISKHGLNVEIIVPQRNLLQYFLAADACILPSVRDPFPNFMLQSGLHRRPFIGANVDGIGQLIKDGKNGLLFESGNSVELAEKIRLFKSNKSLADSCAHKLSDNVIDNYTQNTIIPKIAALYDRLSHQQNN